jgi:hypothetical protein
MSVAQSAYFACGLRATEFVVLYLIQVCSCLSRILNVLSSLPYSDECQPVRKVNFKMLRIYNVQHRLSVWLVCEGFRFFSEWRSSTENRKALCDGHIIKKNWARTGFHDTCHLIARLLAMPMLFY